MASRSAIASTPMIVVAPMSRAPRYGTKTDGAQREHDNGVADVDFAAFSAGKPGRHDVGAHQHLLIRQLMRHRREIDHRIGHQHEFGPGNRRSCCRTATRPSP